MESGWQSVEQVAERLGLHVRTVRGYIRDGRLPAVRIGKQYRIAQADLDAFTGRPPAPARPRTEVSAVVEIDGVGPAAADRLSTFLVAGSQLAGGGGDPLRVQTVYDDGRARLKVIVLGGVTAAADILHTVGGILDAENDMFLSNPGSAGPAEIGARPEDGSAPRDAGNARHDEDGARGAGENDRREPDGDQRAKGGAR